MATPSAILSVLVSADTGEAVAKLSKFDRQIAATTEVARKGIEARLGGEFNPEAFKRYQAALDKASLKAKNRAAFKAELGANFNNAAFNQYSRAIDKTVAKSEEAKVANHHLSSSFVDVGSKALGTATAVAGVAIGLGEISKASITAAVSFQSSMEMIHTQAGASQKEVDKLSQAVQTLAPSVATGPNELAKGLYHLESQGLRGAKAMDALKIAAEGAKVGNADLEDLTNTLGAAVVSGIKGIQNLKQGMGALNAVVGSGDMRMQDLADALGTGLLGPMKQFGVSLKDVGAALAVFGDNNIRGADAGTKLLSTIRIMAAPSNAAAKALKGIGLGATQLADDIRKKGLVAAFEDLQTHLKATGKSSSEQARILAAAFGGRQATGVQLLLGQLDRLKSKEGEVGKGAHGFGEDFKATSKTLSFRVDQMRASFEALGIKIGMALSPVIGVLNDATRAVLRFVGQMQSGKGAGGEFATIIKTAFDAVKTAVNDVVTTFTDLFKLFQQNNPLVVAFAGAIAGVTVAIVAVNVALTAYAVALRVAAIAQIAFDAAADANPYVLVALAIIALVGALVALYEKVKFVHDFVNSAWQSMKTAALAVFGPMITAIVNGFKSLAPTIGPFLRALAGAVSTAFNAISGVVHTAFNVIKGIITPIARVVIPQIVDAFKTAWTETKVVLGVIAGGIKAAFQIIKGAIEFFTGLFTLDFSKMWKGIQDIFGGALKFILGLITGAFSLFKAAGLGLITQLGDGISAAWTILKKAFGVGVHALVGVVTGIGDDMFNAGKAIIGFLGDGFTAAFDDVWGVIRGFINDIIGVLDLIPGVNIHKIGGSAPGSVGAPAAANPFAQNLHIAGHATGGVVKGLGYFAGEEGPQHPEVILATNPAYRQRNLGLWAQAGSMLGVPGFAGGGVLGAVGSVLGGAVNAVTSIPGTVVSLASSAAGAIAGLLPSLPSAPSLPGWIAGLPGELLSKAASFLKSKITGLFSSGGGGGGGGGGNATNQRLGETMMLAAGWGADQWPSLLALWNQESGWDANAVNKSSGAYGIPQALGHGHPFNLGDAPAQIAWGLNYIRGRYGSPAAAEAHERANNWYRKGGIFGIPGFAQGGFVGDPGTNFSVGEEPTIVSRLTALARSIGATIYGISGYRTPQHSVAVGGFANDPHTRGAAADIGVNSQLRSSAAQLSRAQLAKFGLDRPFDESGSPSNTEVNHIQLLPGWTATPSSSSSTASTAAKGIAKKAKKFIPTPVRKLQLPHNIAKVPAGSTPAITNLIGQINGVLDPNRGTAAALSDRISMTGQIDDQRVSEYQVANPNTDASTGLIAFTDPVTGTTTHSIDQTFVNMRVAELQQLLTWQTRLRDQLQAQLARIADLIAKLQAAIFWRRLYIGGLRAKIAENISIINSLSRNEKNPKLTRRQKSNIAAQITALQNQNNQLGGATMKAGTGGLIGKVSGEISSMNDTISTMRDNRLAIVGASGIGGTLGAANLDVQSFADQLNVFSPKATQAALAGASAADAAGAGAATDNTPATDPATLQMLQQLLNQAHLETSVAEAQLGVLQASPPFGGSFAQGGIVPGPLGTPRTIIAHAGEVVGQPGDTHVHVHVADGMGWLKQFINVEVGQSTRRDARNASRMLPGSKGRY